MKTDGQRLEGDGVKVEPCFSGPEETSSKGKELAEMAGPWEKTGAQVEDTGSAGSGTAWSANGRCFLVDV